MMRNREYWQERFKELEQARYDFAEDVFNDISGEYDRAIQRLDNELSYWYQRYAFDNKISYQEAKKLLNSKELRQFKTDLKTFIAKAKEADLSEEWQKRLENAYLRMRVSRIEAIQLMLQQHLEVLFGNQLDQLDKKLKELYTEDYNHTVFNIQQGAGIGSSFIGVDTNKLDTVLSKPWADDGKNFSSRIWEHKSNLVTLLNKELLQAVIRGDDYQTATNNIAHKMNVSRTNAGRLVMTESAFIGTKAQKDCFTNLGVEEYEFVATLDRRTSPICRSMDGKHFKISDMKIGTNAPPLHPRCRSCTAPYFEDAEDLERIARGENGGIYSVPGNMTYEQWRKNLLHSDGVNVIIKEKNIPFDLQLFAIDYTKYSDRALASSIRKHQNEIIEHTKKIQNPMDYIDLEHPQRNNPKYIEGLKKHWAKEIENFSEQIERAKAEQKRRKQS